MLLRFQCTFRANHSRFGIYLKKKIVDSQSSETELDNIIAVRSERSTTAKITVKG